MAKYKIIPSSRTIVQSPISIGHKAEKGVEAIEFDLTAWVETYGSGTLTVIMRRWGDAIPYPIALEIDENNKATWTLSDTDTARAGMAYAQLNYIVGETVVKKSDIYTFRVMDSLTGEGEPPEAYESWLEHLTHLAAEAMAEVLDIEGIVTDKTLTVDGGIADAKAAGDALALKADKSTTYTKTQVDQMIEDVEVETDTTLSVSGAPADAKATGDALSALEDQFTEETDQLKADLDNLHDPVSIIWTKGIFAAASGAIVFSDNGASNADTISGKGLKLSLADGCKAVILLYSGATYLGKCNANGTISKQSGGWKFFTGDVDIAALFAEFEADGFRMSVIPTDSTTITTETVQTYGDSHATVTQLPLPDMAELKGNNFSDLSGLAWIVGSIKDAGTNDSGTRRIRCDYTYFEAGTVFLIDDSRFMFCVHRYSGPDASTWLGQNGYFIKGAYVLEESCYIRMMVAYNDSRVCTADDKTLIPPHILCAKAAGLSGRFFEQVGAFRESQRDSAIMSINHRGFSYVAPENTLPAYIESARHGFSYVETDVLFTSDDVPVLLHDSTINRTARNADGSALESTVTLANITYEQALEYDFGIYKGEQWAGTKIPTFEEFLVLCKKLALHPVIELKDSVGGSYWTDERINAVSTIIDAVGMQNEVVFLGFAISAMTKIKAKYPKATLILGMDGSYADERFASLIANGLSLKGDDNRVLLSVSYEAMNATRYAAVNAAGLGTVIWTVNSYSVLYTMDKSVCGVLSDYIRADEAVRNYILNAEA